MPEAFRQEPDRQGVEILDPRPAPAPSFANFSSIFADSRRSSRYKYKEELHANEVAILPYYVANLNIEATYAAITGQYAEFPNLCFVDTLDNVAGLGKFSGHQDDLFGAISGGKRRAHQAAEHAQDFRHHRQSAL